MSELLGTPRKEPARVSGAVALLILLMLLAQLATAYFAFRSYQANVAVCNVVTADVISAHRCGQ